MFSGDLRRTLWKDPQEVVTYRLRTTHLACGTFSALNRKDEAHKLTALMWACPATRHLDSGMPWLSITLDRRNGPFSHPLPLSQQMQKPREKPSTTSHTTHRRSNFFMDFSSKSTDVSWHVPYRSTICCGDWSAITVRATGAQLLKGEVTWLNFI